MTSKMYRHPPAERTYGTIRETVGYFGSNPDKMLGITYAPEHDATAAVVICPPVFLEKVITNQAETALARALAQRGIAVQRFDYRGFGHSDGDGRDVTYEAMVEDAADAARLLEELHPTANIGFVGTRWGTMVAAAVARCNPGAPVAMWEPITGSRAFFREASRALAIAVLADAAGGDQDPPKPRKLVSIIEQDGMADVFGYPIYKALYESSVDRELSTEMGTDARPLQLVTFGTEPQQGSRGKLIAEWERQGFAVNTHVSDGVPTWWFLGERPLDKEELSDVTASWLVAQLESGSR